MFKAAMLASLVIAAGSAPTLAVAQREQPTKTVIETRGYDFANEKDVRTVHDMLWRAAVSVCDSHIQQQLVDEMSDRKCAHDSLDRAVAALHQPLLTAYHQGHAIKSNEPKLARERSEPSRPSESPGG
ncbi:MAG TPA: UrcA family protein [Phenylobacterium sp.]|jgi:UrcA family protein